MAARAADRWDTGGALDRNCPWQRITLGNSGTLTRARFEWPLEQSFSIQVTNNSDTPGTASFGVSTFTRWRSTLPGLDALLDPLSLVAGFDTGPQDYLAGETKSFNPPGGAAMIYTDDAAASAVPEPGTMALAGLPRAGLGFPARRRKA